MTIQVNKKVYRPTYDVYVHPTAGVGDYTSIATALTTEGDDKTIYIARGSYTESADLEPQAGQRLYFNAVAVTFSGEQALIFGESNVKLYGDVSLAGKGVANGTTYSLLNASSGFTNIDASQCEIKLMPTNGAWKSQTASISTSKSKFRILLDTLTLTSLTDFFGVYLNGGCDDSDIDVEINAISLNADSGSLYGIVTEGSNTAEGNRVRVKINGITNAGTGVTYGVYANDDRSVYDVLVEDVTTSGGAGVGFKFHSASSKSTAYGVLNGSDTELQNTGTNNDTDALNSI